MLATALYEPPVDFGKRTSFDLRRIVEDQVWQRNYRMISLLLYIPSHMIQAI